MISNIFALLNGLLLGAYGLWIIFLTISHWNHENKTLKIKISEIVYGILFIVNGVILQVLFSDLELKVQIRLQMYIFFAFMGIMAFLWGNIIYTYFRIKNNPELLNPDAKPCRIPEIYWKELEEKFYKSEKARTNDIIKDISRKALHFVILAVVIGVDLWAKSISAELINSGMNVQAFRNFIYIIAANFFIFMFTTADSFRVYNLKVLPDWGLNWYGKSVDIKTERYTYISSVPFLLTLLLFVLIPFEILLCSAIVSCIADAVASIVGKLIGSHKVTHFGRYPHKSYEGMIAGAAASFIGIIMVFQFYPLAGVNQEWQYVFGLVAAITFIYVDIFSKYIVDNILNTLLPGFFIWILIIAFI